MPSFVLFKFILSDTPCNIDPFWRFSPDSCEDWDVSIPIWIKDGTPLVPFSIEAAGREFTTHTGLYFKVKSFPILLHRVGVATHLLDNLPHNKNISVILKSKSSDHVVQNFSFARSEATSESGYTFLPVSGAQPRELDIPAGFEGWLYLEGYGHGAKPVVAACAATHHKHLGDHGVVIFKALFGGTALPVQYSEESCPLVNMEYSLIDPSDIRQLIGARATQNLVEQRRMEDIEKEVGVEVEDNDDIAFISSVDTDRVASTNLKMFVSTLPFSVDYDYLLVTTDQTVLNINTVLNHLPPDPNSWWGTFGLFTNVSEQDLAYASATYPPVPRTPTTVLARHLADFLGTNAARLADFSSVSVSLAVWLAGLGPRLEEDSRWMAPFTSLEKNVRLWKEGKLVCIEDLESEVLESIWKD